MTLAPDENHLRPSSPLGERASVAIDRRFLDLGLRIEAPCADDLLWLEEFLGPAFPVTTNSRNAVEVALRIDPDRVGGWLAEGPTGADLAAFRLERGMARLPVWRTGERERRTWDERSGAFYRVRPDLRRIEVWCREPGKGARRALMRAVREVAMDHATRSDGVLLHASCLDTGSGAIAFSGPKGSGKTTLLIAALAGTTSRFLANDRLFVDLSEGLPHAVSLPSIVSVRESAARLFPELARKLHVKQWSPWLRWQDLTARSESTAHHGKAHSGMSAFQFRRWLGCDATGDAPLRLLVVPHVEDGGAQPRIRRLSPAEIRERLPSLLFSSGAGERSDLFSLEPSGPAASEPVTGWSIATSVPVVELSLPRGRVEAATWFTDLLKHSAAAS
jgi:hypothetical protein